MSNVKLYIENSEMHETNLLNLGVRQATTCNNFKDAYTDRPKNEDVPRQKLVCVCLLGSPKRGIKMAIIGFLGSISINISGPNSILEFMERK